MQLDDFLNLFDMVEHVFAYSNHPEHKEVKLVAIKMPKNVSFYGNFGIVKDMVKIRFKLRKYEKIAKRNYLPDNYHRDIYLKIHNFKQTRYPE